MPFNKLKSRRFYCFRRLIFCVLLVNFLYFAWQTTDVKANDTFDQLVDLCQSGHDR